jgi:hypothetical protein
MILVILSSVSNPFSFIRLRSSVSYVTTIPSTASLHHVVTRSAVWNAVRISLLARFATCRVISSRFFVHDLQWMGWTFTGAWPGLYFSHYLASNYFLFWTMTAIFVFDIALSVILYVDLEKLARDFVLSYYILLLHILNILVRYYSYNIWVMDVRQIFCIVVSLVRGPTPAQKITDVTDSGSLAMTVPLNFPPRGWEN